MKKRLILILAAACLIFGGCGSKVLPTVELFDYYDCDNMPELSEPIDFEAEEFDGVVFRWKREMSGWNGDSIIAIKDGEETPLYSGMPILSVFLSDLNADGYRELCSTANWGSGMIDYRIIVYDYRAGRKYELADRGEYDYVLELRDSVLTVSKREWNSTEELAAGTLGFSWENNRSVLCMKEQE